MKKSDDQFSVPQRQSYVAILQILYKTIKIIVKMIWPVLLIFIVKGSKGKSDYFLYATIGIALLVMIYSIINYFKFVFYVDEDELIQESGIIGRKKISIPFDRIQSINLEQNMIHRMFNVVKLKIDTAGTSKKEVEIDAIHRDTAESLRTILLANKNKSKAKENGDNVRTEKAIEPSSPPVRKIMHLSPLQLVKAGLVENHIRSLGLIIASGFWLMSELDDLGIDLREYGEKLPIAMVGLSILVGLMIFGLVVLVLICLVRMVIVNFDLSFLRTPSGFKITKGLFTRRSISARDIKVQSVAWKDNILQKLIGIYDLTLRQAGMSSHNEESGIHIPGIGLHHIKYVTQELYPHEDFTSIEMHKVSRSWMNRKIFFSVLIAIIFIIAGYFSQHLFQSRLTSFFVVSLGIFILLLFPIKAWLAYKKTSFGYNEEMLRINGGEFGDTSFIAPIYKTQVIKLSQSPFQRARQLYTLTLYNASGSVSIPYIPSPTAWHLTNFIAHKVKTDKRKWM